MNWILDIVTLAIIVIFLIIGGKNGFVKSVVRMVGSFAALAVAYFLSAPVAELFAGDGSVIASTIGRIVGFVVVFFIAFVAVRVVGYLVSKMISSIPFIKKINTLLGCVMGAVEGLFIAFIFCAAVQLVAMGNSGLVTEAHIDATLLAQHLMILPM